MLIGGNCAGLAECGGSLGDSHMRLVEAVVDMMKGMAKAPDLEFLVYQAG